MSDRIVWSVRLILTPILFPVLVVWWIVSTPFVFSKFENALWYVMERFTIILD